MQIKKLIGALGLVGLLSGCPINRSPQPYIYLPVNMNLTIEPNKNIAFDVADKSKELDIASFKAYLETPQKRVDMDLSINRLDLELGGVAMAHWNVSDQYNDIPEGKVDFVLEMTDKKGKTGRYVLPIDIRKRK